MFGDKSFARLARGTDYDVKLPDGRTVRGELVEIFARLQHGGRVVLQFYVRYDDGLKGNRIRLIDPTTRKRWDRQNGQYANLTAVPPRHP